jgi:ribosome-binding protein aMBF1 (putative translation factor)
MSFKTSKPKSKAYPTELRTVGDHICKKRIDLGLSRSDLAKTLGTTQTRVWVWENYETLPKTTVYPKVIEFLGYDPLFDDSGTLKANIENYRRKHGLSNMKLAKQIGISYALLLRLVNDRKVGEKSVQIIQKFFKEPSN